MNLGIFIIPYKEFSPNCDNPCSFTCDTGPDDSLPQMLHKRIEGWDAVVTKALISTCKFNVGAEGGYKFLFMLMQENHPYFDPRAYEMTTIQPQQRPRETIDNYYIRVLDFIFLCGLVDNFPSGIEQDRKVSQLFSCSQHATHFHWMYDHERHNVNHRNDYKQSRLYIRALRDARLLLFPRLRA